MALFKMVIAKAWSSEYDQAKTYAELLKDSNVSESYSGIGKQLLQELPKLMKERVDIDQRKTK